MRTNEQRFIDTIIDPIPMFGPLLADLFYTWSGLADAMNLRGLADAIGAGIGIADHRVAVGAAVAAEAADTAGP